MKPLVSIIIPVFNVDQYLAECLESVCNQTLRDIEIIIIDDGSTDNSPNIIKCFRQEDDRIIFHSQENQGQGIARNWGIENANGKYLGFVDSDDSISLDMYEKMYQKAEAFKIDIIQCEYKLTKKEDLIIDGGEKAIELSANAEIFVSFWSKLYKRSIFINNHIRFPLSPPKMKHQDFAVAIQPLFFAKKIYLLRERLYFYRENRFGSVMNTISEDHLIHLEIALNINKSFLEKHSASDTCLLYYSKIYFSHSISRLKSIIENMRPFDKNKKALIELWIKTFRSSIFFQQGKQYNKNITISIVIFLIDCYNLQPKFTILTLTLVHHILKFKKDISQMNTKISF
ncbi:glycosyltransferase [Flammeovirgaceae bacterium SG7u.111]|nr:glycosyltransferase [Flammeovirgaceae bacterium SG7u.132]WPO34532.1 glycosyltransferase [Flammeovirgaceae bacterium SG7u.111]